MKLEEAKEIINGYGEGTFQIVHEDTSFGDGSVIIRFKYIIDSRNEATRLSDAIQTVLIGKTFKHEFE